MRVYKFTEAKWAVQDICKRRVKVSRLSELNDPFELLAGSLERQDLRGRLRAAAESIDRSKGVVCFSESWQDPLMWSHYGDRHRGICLGFDVQGLERIDYRPNRLTSNLASLCMNTLEQLLLTTKFARWSYERERRLVVELENPIDDLYFRHFDETLTLVEVIAGARCCISWRDAIKKAVRGYKGVSLIKARLAFKTFNVVRQKHNNCWAAGFENDSYWGG